MSGLPQGTSLSHLKSVSLTILEQLAFNPPQKKIGGHASLATPSFRTILESQVRNIPENMLVKVEVRNCK